MNVEPIPKPTRKRAGRSKPKRPTKTQLRNRADRFFSLWIRERDGSCRTKTLRPENCEGNLNLQCAHIVSRSYLATRLDPENALALCRSCHVYYTNHPLEWDDAIETLFGMVYLRRIKTKALSGARVGTRPDWKAEAERWEAEWIRFGTR